MSFPDAGQLSEQDIRDIVDKAIRDHDTGGGGGSDPTVHTFEQSGGTAPPDAETQRVMLEAAKGIGPDSQARKTQAGTVDDTPPPVAETTPMDYTQAAMLEAARKVGPAIVGKTGGPYDTAVLPNGNPSAPTSPAPAPASDPTAPAPVNGGQGWITRLGDQSPAPTGSGAGGGSLPAKNTDAFYRGEYTPGKGVADADGYYNPDYHSEANIEMNARRGDPSAVAKLEVMAAAGNGDAKAILADMGGISGVADYLKGETAHAWDLAHNSQIIDEVKALGAGKGANLQAEQNLLDQRVQIPAHIEALKTSDPVAYGYIADLAGVGARNIQFNAGNVSYEDENKNVHTTRAGEVAAHAKQLADAIAANSGTTASGTGANDAAAQVVNKQNRTATQTRYSTVA